MTHRYLRTPAAVVAAMSLALAFALVGCGDSDDDTDAGPQLEAPAGEELQITEVWARTSPSMAAAGAVYMTIYNPADTDDALQSAAVDPSIAETAEVHQTTMEPAGDDDPMDGDAMDGDAMDGDAMDGDAMGDGTDEGHGQGDGGTGMMRMSEVDEIPLPAGSSVPLEPGGYHIMLMGLAAPLEAGTTLDVTLTFAQAGEVTVTADVRDDAP